LTDLENPLGFLDFEITRMARQSANEGGKSVSTMNRPLLFAEECSISWNIYL